MITSNKKGSCINCNSSNLGYSETELIEDMLAYSYQCYDCETTGKEWYKLTYVESITY